MSKYSLQLEERESYQAHQRAVDEQHILRGVEMPHATAGPARSDTYVPPTRNGALSMAAALGLSKSEEGGEAAGPALSAAQRVQSKYLRSLEEGDRPTALTSAGDEKKHQDVPLSSSLHLKAELTQLDKEIGECSH